ncbi:hypothetical protein ACJX0J_020737, partial [Zea mays]
SLFLQKQQQKNNTIDRESVVFRSFDVSFTNLRPKLDSPLSLGSDNYEQLPQRKHTSFYFDNFSIVSCTVNLIAALHDFILLLKILYTLSAYIPIIILLDVNNLARTHVDYSELLYMFYLLVHRA